MTDGAGGDHWIPGLQNLQLPPVGQADKDGMTAKANHGPQNYHGPTAEIVGFICRWFLLAGAVVLIGLVAWECLLATVGVSQDVHSRFVVADTIVRVNDKADSKCYQWGLLVGQQSSSDALAALGVCLAEPVSVCRYSQGDRFWARWTNCQPGRVPVVYQGVPYSSLAFERQSASILGVPDGRAVTLIDLPLARIAARDQTDIWRHTLAALTTYGETALFFDGSADQFAATLAEYRQSGGEMPVVFTKEPIPYVFSRVAGDLRRRRDNAISIVTANADLASKAGRAGFVAHLITTSSAPTQPIRGVVRHASLEQFKDSLPSPPIR